MEIKIVNVVARVILGVDIPLEKMSIQLKNTEYNPEQFPGLVLRLKRLGIVVLVFSSGKLVCTGAKNLEKVKEGVREVIEILKQIGVEVTQEPQITIQNMVASGNIDMTLNLNKLAFDLPNSEYAPETFPGLIYKVPNSHITFLLFGTGKIVCTGAKNEQEIEESVKALKEKLSKLVS